MKVCPAFFVSSVAKKKGENDCSSVHDLPLKQRQIVIHTMLGLFLNPKTDKISTEFSLLPRSCSSILHVSRQYIVDHLLCSHYLFIKSLEFQRLLFLIQIICLLTYKCIEKLYV